MVIWPKIVATGDEGWDKACALLRTLPLDTRRRNVGQEKGEGFKESADEFFERPNIWVDRKLVPAPYYSYRLDFAVSCSVLGVIPVENGAELTEFKRVVSEALSTDITVAEHKLKFRRLNEPDVSYHGVVYTEALGPAAFIGRTRVVPLRNMGADISPFNSFLILQGLETLPLRMDRICANSERIADYLRGHAKVAWVNYAGLPDHPDHALVQKYMDGKASGILTFGVKGTDCGGSEAGARFQDALQLFTRLVNIGDAKSLACHPASTTHRQLAPAELAKAGVSEEMIRLSVGIEHIDDLIADLEQALAAA